MRVHVEITGRVQGVFFRDSCRSEALRRGVSGWVRNTAAGSVEAELEGEDDAVQALVDWCRVGPPFASVTGVSVSPLTPTGESGFEVR
ncbi:acylphosphatase [Nocardioides sp.]|uniref:acylphosphatase n=1 Tax=Nocardioides sp. TaxID=35761 RepID=UPI002ED53D13